MIPTPPDAALQALRQLVRRQIRPWLMGISLACLLLAIVVALIALQKADRADVVALASRIPITDETPPSPDPEADALEAQIQELRAHVEQLTALQAMSRPGDNGTASLALLQNILFTLQSRLDSGEPFGDELAAGISLSQKAGVVIPSGVSADLARIAKRGVRPVIDIQRGFEPLLRAPAGETKLEKTIGKFVQIRRKEQAVEGDGVAFLKALSLGDTTTALAEAQVLPEAVRVSPEAISLLAELEELDRARRGIGLWRTAATEHLNETLLLGKEP
ncbi:MAG: hypothetical protein ACK5O9_07900 [Holosporales bacterium]|jgi:hypothetical protein